MPVLYGTRGTRCAARAGHAEQSKDPTSDLRGMGVLGLYTLVYFVEQYRHVARAILAGNRAYPFAAVGVNVTQMLCNLLGLTDGMPRLGDDGRGRSQLTTDRMRRPRTRAPSSHQKKYRPRQVSTHRPTMGFGCAGVSGVPGARPGI